MVPFAGKTSLVFGGCSILLEKKEDLYKIVIRCGELL